MFGIVGLPGEVNRCCSYTSLYGVAIAGAVEDVPVDQEVMFGIVAGNVRIAVRALRDWCQALGLPYVKPASRVRSVCVCVCVCALQCML